MSEMMNMTSDMADAMALIANLTAEIDLLKAGVQESNDSIDIFFVFTMGVICFLMQAGFGLLEVGCIRAKNAQNIMFKNMMDACVTAIIY